MSFFDDEPDEPTRVTRPARPRRAGSSTRGGGGSPDVARRRLIAFAGLAIIAILLIVVINSCSSNARKNALKDYNRDAGTLATESLQQVSRPLFDALTAGSSANQVSVAISQVRQKADDEASAARSLDPPDDMKAADRDLELVLNLRAEAVGKISDQVTKALGTGPAAQDGLRRIAGQMQAFLASDVVYSQRVKPLIVEALDKNGISGQPTPDSRFLPALNWLDYPYVASRVNPDAGGAGATSTGEPRPGTHGHGIESVAANGQTLTPGAAPPNRIAAVPPPSFDVRIANQGVNDESNVKVTVSVKAGNARAITQSATLRASKAGTATTVTIRLPRSPPRNSAGTVTVTVAKVPGERTTTNNTQTYTALFT
jgi:hypothetical protein